MAELIRLHEAVKRACDGEVLTVKCLITGEVFKHNNLIMRRAWTQAHVLSEYKIIEDRDDLRDGTAKD